MPNTRTGPAIANFIRIACLNSSAGVLQQFTDAACTVPTGTPFATVLPAILVYGDVVTARVVRGALARVCEERVNPRQRLELARRVRVARVLVRVLRWVGDRPAYGLTRPCCFRFRIARRLDLIGRPRLKVVRRIRKHTWEASGGLWFVRRSSAAEVSGLRSIPCATRSLVFGRLPCVAMEGDDAGDVMQCPHCKKTWDHDINPTN